MEITAQVLKELELFNRGRTSDKGVYLISMATEYRPYYALWREFPSPHSYLFDPYAGSNAGRGFRPCFLHAAELQCAVGDRRQCSV